MGNGWIKLHRQILEWEWYKDPVAYRLFTHLLLKANHQEQGWQGIIVGRGQLVAGRVKLSQETGLTQQQIRTGLKRLKSTSEITIKTTNRFSIITIANWDIYQDEEMKATSKTASKRPSKQPTVNQQLTTNKNVKNVKNVKKDIYVRFIKFFNEVTKSKFKGSQKVRDKFNTRLKEGWTLKEIGKAVKNAANDDYLMGDNPGNRKYLTPEYILRADKLDEWASL
jgi:uncharacterized phage protein (TIGR02220 family)